MFSAREEQVAALLAIGKSQVDIQRETGIDTKTIRRMLKREEFRQVVRSTRRAISFTVVGALAGALDDAVASLTLIASDGERASDRIRACDVILNQYLRFEDAIDMSERVSALEVAAGLNRKVPTLDPASVPAGQVDPDTAAPGE